MYNSFEIILPVFNEHTRCKRAYTYYARFAKVIIVDNYSTDNTPSILRGLGAECIHQIRNNGTIQSTAWFQQVLPLIDSPYFLLASCSELCPPSLLEIFGKIAALQQYSIVAAPVKTYNAGHSYNIDGGFFSGKVHYAQRFFHGPSLDLQRIKIHGRFYPLPSSDRPQLTLPLVNTSYLIHLRDCDVRLLVSKHLDYAMVEADESAGTYTSWRLFLTTFARVIREFGKFAQNNPRHWRYPFVRDILSRVLLHFLIAFRVYELKSGHTLATSTRLNDQIWNSYVSSSK